MTSTHPLPDGLLFYWFPADDGSTIGKGEPLTIGTAIERGFEVFRACMLNETSMGVEAYRIVASLLWIATERDEHAVLASAPLIEELRAEGVRVPVEWVERLEALIEELYVEAREFHAEPMDESAIAIRDERIERNSRPSWIADRLLAPVRMPRMPRPLVAPRARARERRAGASSSRSRVSSSADDSPLPRSRPPLGRRLLNALRSVLRGRP